MKFERNSNESIKVEGLIRKGVLVKRTPSMRQIFRLPHGWERHITEGDIFLNRVRVIYTIVGDDVDNLAHMTITAEEKGKEIMLWRYRYPSEELYYENLEALGIKEFDAIEIFKVAIARDTEIRGNEMIIW